MTGLRWLRRQAGVLAALICGLVVAGSVPLAAAAFDATNAHKVDGRHAVGAGASPAARAGKLVATDAQGRLPGSIIARAPNTAQLAGRAATAYQRRITATCPDAAAMTAVTAAGVTCAEDRISFGNAQTLDGLDSTDLAVAGRRIIVVQPSESASDSGDRLLEAVAAIPTSGAGQPSATNPWLVRVEPGRYDLDDDHLALPDHVSLEGAGPATTIESSGDGSSAVQHSVVATGDNAEIRSVTLVNNGPGDAVGLHLGGIGVRVRDVEVTVAGETAIGIYGNVFQSTDVLYADIAHVDVTASSPMGVAGIYVSGRSRIIDATVDVAGDGPIEAIGIGAQRNTQIRAATVKVTAPDSESARAVQVNSGTTIRDSVLAAQGLGADVAVLAGGSVLNIAHSQISGAVSNAGGPIVNCVGAYNADFQLLTADCQ